MTTTYTTTSTTGKLTITFEHAKGPMAAVLTDGCHYLWNNGKGPHGTTEAPILFTDLTVPQMAQIIDDHIKEVLVDAASTYKSLADQEVARTAAATASTTTYKLSE